MCQNFIVGSFCGKIYLTAVTNPEYGLIRITRFSLCLFQGYALLLSALLVYIVVSVFCAVFLTNRTLALHLPAGRQLFVTTGGALWTQQRSSGVCYKRRRRRRIGPYYRVAPSVRPYCSDPQSPVRKLPLEIGGNIPRACKWHSHFPIFGHTFWIGAKINPRRLVVLYW